ncbi:MAG: pentapeptide repeat-containing protein [Planctomycetes bacterium]|nr:pentapeptide repeat-containing protein [Planctomycetota bacterium]
MANPEHVSILRKGKEEVDRAYADKRVDRFDVSGEDLTKFGLNLSNYHLNGANLRNAKLENMDLSGVNLEGADLTGANLQNVQFIKANLKKAIFFKANLQSADFSGANCHEALFQEANLTSAKTEYAQKYRDQGLTTDFTDADISGADLTHVQFPSAIFTSAKFIGCTLKACNFSNCIVDNADFTRADLDLAQLREVHGQKSQWKEAKGKVNLASSKLNQATFDDVKFEGGSFNHSDLKEASFCNACLKGCNLEGANLTNADLKGADFLEASLNTVEMAKVRTAHLACNLERTFIRAPDHDVKHFDASTMPWWNKRMSWEVIRTFGKLPLFGLSSSLIVGLPVFFYLVDLYNNKVGILRGWAEKRSSDYPEVFRNLSESLLARLHNFSLDWSSVALFISMILLLIASLFYSFFCPQPIKEYSSVQWKFEFKGSLAHYLPYSWKRPWARITCWILYVSGASLGGFVLIFKLFHAAIVMWRNIGF